MSGVSKTKGERNYIRTLFDKVVSLGGVGYQFTNHMHIEIEQLGKWMVDGGSNIGQCGWEVTNKQGEEARVSMWQWMRVVGISMNSCLD